MTNAAIAPELLARRTHSLAARLLTGTATAQLHAYRRVTDKDVTVLATGFDSDGALLVALAEDSDFETEPVRFTLTHRAQVKERSVVVVGSLHGLGTLTPYRREEDERLSGLLAFVDPARQLYRLELEKLLMHDSAGVTRLALEQVFTAARQNTVADEFQIAELARSLDEDLLSALATAAIDHDVPAVAWQPQALPTGVCDLAHETLLLDVDGTGVTLMVVADGRSQCVFVPFGADTAPEEDVRAAVFALLAQGWFRDANRVSDTRTRDAWVLGDASTATPWTHARFH